MSWSQSVDQALCFGWIDGVRKSIDNESYCIRFTPRRSTSNWSAINIKKIEELTKAGLMKPAGIKAYSLRKDNKSEIYSYENDTLFIDSDLELQFKENKKAWDFFIKQAPSYRKAIISWIMSARQGKNQTITIRENNKNKRTTKTTGLQKIYFESGQLYSYGEMLDDYKEGKWNWYYENGNTSSSVSYRNDKKECKQIMWSEAGEKTKEEFYKNGVLIEEKLF